MTHETQTKGPWTELRDEIRAHNLPEDKQREVMQESRDIHHAYALADAAVKSMRLEAARNMVAGNKEAPKQETNPQPSLSAEHASVYSTQSSDPEERRRLAETLRIPDETINEQEKN